MLGLIWTLSIVLCAISLLVMAVLIALRIFAQRRLREDAAARQRVLRALITFSEDKNEDALLASLRSIPPRVALDAGFEFLALLRGDEHARIIHLFIRAGLQDHIAVQLRNGNEAARIHAAEMFAVLPAEFGTAALLRALDGDSSREVRIAAAISLCELRALPPLQTTLRKIGVRGQRSRRLVELFKCFPPERVQELQDYAARIEETPFVRAAAIEALAQSGDYNLAGFFISAARDRSGDVAAAAVRALARLGDPDTVAILAEAMRSSDWQVRADAADGAGRFASPQLIEPLVQLLDDEAWTVRYAAAKAIRLIAPDGETALRDIASGESSRRQRTASLTLSEGLAT
jgi:HEAT repeat protein